MRNIFFPNNFQLGNIFVVDDTIMILYIMMCILYKIEHPVKLSYMVLEECTQLQYATLGENWWNEAKSVKQNMTTGSLLNDFFS